MDEGQLRRERRERLLVGGVLGGLAVLAMLAGAWLGATLTELRQTQAAQAQLLQQIIERSNQHSEQLRGLQGGSGSTP